MPAQVRGGGMESAGAAEPEGDALARARLHLLQARREGMAKGKKPHLGKRGIGSAYLRSAGEGERGLRLGGQHSAKCPRVQEGKGRWVRGRERRKPRRARDTLRQCGRTGPAGPRGAAGTAGTAGTEGTPRGHLPVPPAFPPFLPSPLPHSPSAWLSGSKPVHSGAS